MPDIPVLIVGAGPTGLVLALWLTRLGVRVRIVDKAAGPGTTSRAIGVQARILEFYRQIGLADTVVDRGHVFGAVNLWVRGRKVGRAVFGDMGVGLSPFPYMLMYPQHEHEQLLIEQLARFGVHVERRIELVGFEERGDRISARLKRIDGTDETCDTAYLAGCDGAHSRMRETLLTGFPGGTYPHLFYVADVTGSGPVMDGEFHGSLDDVDFLGVFPMKGRGRARLIGIVRDDAASRHDDLGWEDVNQSILRRLDIKIERVDWFSTYHVHHRVTGHFRRGRAFLLGDAAHIHSPVGGQGMNTGIGDAINLAWKLAAVVRGRADETLLDTYEPERIGFARRLVATTDRAFTLISSPGRIAGWVRTRIVPVIVNVLFRFRLFRRLMFLTISQIMVNYRGSSLSAGRGGRVRGGDRLPWVRLDTSDNFSRLATFEWQVHVYGEPSQEIVRACQRRNLPLHVFAWQSTMGRAGLKQDAVYLVRPDGYVGLVDADPTAPTLGPYLDRWKIGSRASAPP